jgi:hypothetical protein
LEEKVKGGDNDRKKDKESIVSPPAPIFEQDPKTIEKKRDRNKDIF